MQLQLLFVIFCASLFIFHQTGTDMLKQNSSAVNTTYTLSHIFFIFYLSALNPSIHPVKGPTSSVSRATTSCHPNEPRSQCKVNILACFCMDFQLRLPTIINHTITLGNESEKLILSIIIKITLMKQFL